MNQKGAVKRYIQPGIWVPIGGFVAFVLGIGLFSTENEDLYLVGGLLLMLSLIPILRGLIMVIPGLVRTSSTIRRLGSAGQLELADAEVGSGRMTESCRGRAACTDHFLLAHRGARACAYTDILWVYKHKFTQTLLFIPIHTSESLMVCTKKETFRIDLGRKDKNGELLELIKTIYRHNPKVLVGYSAENKRSYKAMVKAGK